MSGFKTEGSFGGTSNEEEQHSAPHSEFDPDTLIEEMTPNELAPVVRDATLLEDIAFEPEYNRFNITLPYGRLLIRPPNGTIKWDENTPQKEFYFELRIENLQVNRGELLNELQQRFVRTKVYTNNSSQLCIAQLISVQYGVSAEQVEYLITNFLEEAILIASDNELVSSPKAEDFENFNTTRRH